MNSQRWTTTVKPLVAGLVGLAAPLCMACGSYPGVRANQIEYPDFQIEGNLLPWALVALCAWDDEDECERVIRRLNAGETIVVRDPIYYEPVLWDGYSFPQYPDPLTVYAQNAGLDSTPMLVNRIQPSSTAPNQWTAEVLVLYQGNFYEPDVFLPQELNAPFAIASIYSTHHSHYYDWQAEQFTVEEIPDIDHVVYHGPFELRGLGLRGCAPDEQLRPVFIE